jgi:hypothetical protein
LIEAQPCRLLLALCTTVALMVATAVYSQHALGQPQHDHAHCDLCLHLGSAAGSRPSLSVPGRPVLATTLVRLAHYVALPARRIVRPQLPRGPPALLSLI